MFHKKSKKLSDAGIEKRASKKERGSDPAIAAFNISDEKRHSKLFSFGKKDKRKPHILPLSHTESAEASKKLSVSGLRQEPSNVVIPKDSQTNAVQRSSVGSLSEYTPGQCASPEAVNEKCYSDISHSNDLHSFSTAAEALEIPPLDFGNDGSALFQSFTADVLRATEEKLKGVDLRLPALQRVLSDDSSRKIAFKRRSTGDFGFSLIRSQVRESDTGTTKLIHLLEPSEDVKVSELLPGDRLVEVNGISVEGKSREEIIQTLAIGDDVVTVTVVPVPELAELSVRRAALHASTDLSVAIPKPVSLARSSSIKKGAIRKFQVKDSEKERAWLEAERVWFVHPGGFSAGRLSKVKSENGEVVANRVKLDHGGEVLEVDENRIERANPPQCDRAEDLSTLRYLNESGCLHTLRQRYGGNLVHTYAGSNLIVIGSPFKLGIYTDKVIQMFRGCKQEDMPPHIYAMAQTSYRAMMATGTKQSIVLQGQLGAGKTYSLGHIVNYLTVAASSARSRVSAEKMDCALAVLRSFGHARLKGSTSSTRFRLLIDFEFDTAGMLQGANMETYLLEKHRVTHHPADSTNFFAFYQLMATCDEKLRRELLLEAALKEENAYLDFKELENKEHGKGWIRLQHAMSTLGVSTDEARSLWSVLAAIVHLGGAGISLGSTGGPYFANPAAVQRAAMALGSTEEELARVIFSQKLKPKAKGRSRTGSISSLKSLEGKTSSLSVSSMLSDSDVIFESSCAAFESFVIGLYVEVFAAVVWLINRALNSPAKPMLNLYVLDGPGFYYPALDAEPAAYNHLCVNYACEKLQGLFHYSVFTSMLERYDREGVDVNYEGDDALSPENAIHALDKFILDRRQRVDDMADPKGIFWIVEEESARPKATEEAIMEKIRAIHRSSQIVGFSEARTDVFTISHMQRTVSVQYSLKGCLRQAKEHPTAKMAHGVLTDSSKQYISELFSGSRSGPYQSDASPFRSNRQRSNTVLTPSRKSSLFMQMKSQIDSLVEILGQSAIRFVCCFAPNASYGSLPLVEEADRQLSDGTLTLDVPYVRHQLRLSHLREAMRIQRQGFPEHMSFPEFRRRFDILLPSDQRDVGPVLDEKQAVSKMVDMLDLDDRRYRLGLSQIFFRVGMLAQLEDLRDDKLAGTIIDFQAFCRGFLGRKKFEKLKLHRTAISCVQRNVRKWLLVKHWPWWRLYTRVLPLLDVHRTEHELKKKVDEVGILVGKAEKLEVENKQLLDSNSRFKNKVQELVAQLSEVNSSLSSVNELLDQESSDRLRLEEELEQARMEAERLQRQNEALECQVGAETRCKDKNNGYHLREVDELDEDEGDQWLEKYKKLSREYETLKKRLSDQTEEEVNDLINQKRQSDKLLAEERVAVDDLQRQLGNSKRKVKSLNAELEDMKLILEAAQGHNIELEKKQRKFDQEMNGLKEELQGELAKHDDHQKDRNKLASEKLSLQRELSEKEQEISTLKRKVDILSQELEDSEKGTENDELINLKRMVRHLEGRLQDQEEELDEQAGQVQQLEQAKLKLEMAYQRDKQTHQKDLEAKDEEIEQIKADCHRKIRAVEEQLEEEIAAKADLVKSKRDLERQIYELQHSPEEGDTGGTKRKLKKELRKYKVLYRDAKAALESQASSTADSAELKALRTKLQDTEFAKHMAVKAKTQLETDLEELHNQIDALAQSKTAMDEKCLALSRENAEAATRLDDVEDEMENVLRKNKALIAHSSVLEAELLDLKVKLREAAEEKEAILEKVNNLTNKLMLREANSVDKLEHERSNIKIRELESKIETETSSKIKLEHTVSRLKSQLERVQDERDSLQNNFGRLQQNSSRFERQARDYRNEMDHLKRQEADHKARKEEVESQLQSVEEELAAKKLELVKAEKRIRDLQDSLERDVGGSSSDDNDVLDDSDDDSSFRNRTSSIKRRTSSSASTHKATSRFAIPSSSGHRTPARRVDSVDKDFASVAVGNSRFGRPISSSDGGYS